MVDTEKDEHFLIPLPGGRTARVPVQLLEKFVDPSAHVCHGVSDAVADDVTPHSMSIDQATGASIWHTEWELGQCDYTDDSGMPQSAYVWHRHPLGNEYTEIYQK